MKRILTKEFVHKMNDIPEGREMIATCDITEDKRVFVNYRIPFSSEKVEYDDYYNIFIDKLIERISEFCKKKGYVLYSY
ncbi:MAG: hypothetical protein ACOC3Z_02095 [Nanoarchaeota archaeon]